jgi:hypothetical protein
MTDNKDPIEQILKDGRRVERAAQRAVREALRMHKLLGNPVAVWRDGKVVWIAPEDIVIEEEPDA